MAKDMLTAFVDAIKADARKSGQSVGVPSTLGAQVLRRLVGPCPKVKELVFAGIQRGGYLNRKYSVPVASVPVIEELRTLYKNSFVNPFFLTLLKDSDHGNRSVFYVLDEIDLKRRLVFRQVGVGHITAHDNVNINETDGTHSFLRQIRDTDIFEFERNRVGVHVPDVDDKPFTQASDHVILVSPLERNRILTQVEIRPTPQVAGNPQIQIQLDDDGTLLGTPQIQLRIDDTLLDLDEEDEDVAALARRLGADVAGAPAVAGGALRLNLTDDVLLERALAEAEVARARAATRVPVGAPAAARKKTYALADLLAKA